MLERVRALIYYMHAHIHEQKSYYSVLKFYMACKQALVNYMGLLKDFKKLSVN